MESKGKQPACCEVLHGCLPDLTKRRKERKICWNTALYISDRKEVFPLSGRTYKIAYFAVDWNYELVDQTLRGLKQYTDMHEEVVLRIFDCFGTDQGNAKDKSEYRIFSLPDLSTFDGAIILGNQVILQSVRDELVRRIDKAGIPAVAIGCPLPGCVLVVHDNHAAQKTITEHVIREHHARRLVYLTGNLYNNCPEGHQRLAGFLDACRENCIPTENIQVLEKTWRTTDGADTAAQWLEEKLPLPDAFICANDEMALGMLETLQENNIKVPDDVIVTGYDNLDSAALSCPRLSSIFCDYRQLNYRAMETVIGMIDNRNVPSTVYSDFSLIASESCGCSDRARPDTIRSRYYRQTRFLRSFYLLQEQLAGELFEAGNLKDLTAAVLRNRAIFGCHDIFLCINDYYFDNYEKTEWTQDSETYGAEMVLASRSYTRFPTHQLLPEPYLSRERFLIFYPLHYNTYSIGYIAMDGMSEAAKMNLHESIFNFLEIAIENIRKKELLRHFNEKLDHLSIHDGLTQLYNRFGLERYGEETFRRLIRKYGSAQVLFTDMDDMKTINDRWGHQAGDAALRAVAKILRDNCGEEDFIMRYGGDEFVVIAAGTRPDLVEKILASAEAWNKSSGQPFRLGLSVGCVLSAKKDQRTLEDCIRKADSLMYEIKTSRKVGR